MYELYDIEKDPGETTNLYFEHPEIVEKMIQKISKIVEDGRSTTGIPQQYEKDNWKQISWMNF